MPEHKYTTAVEKIDKCTYKITISHPDMTSKYSYFTIPNTKSWFCNGVFDIESRRVVHAILVGYGIKDAITQYALTSGILHKIVGNEREPTETEYEHEKKQDTEAKKQQTKEVKRMSTEVEKDMTENLEELMLSMIQNTISNRSKQDQEIIEQCA